MMMVCFKWVFEKKNKINKKTLIISNISFEIGSRALIQYKDDILPVKEIPLWR